MTAVNDKDLLRNILRLPAPYGGMDLTELRQIKALEEENSRLKRIVTDGTNTHVARNTAEFVSAQVHMKSEDVGPSRLSISVANGCF